MAFQSLNYDMYNNYDDTYVYHIFDSVMGNKEIHVPTRGHDTVLWHRVSAIVSCYSDKPRSIIVGAIAQDLIKRYWTGCASTFNSRICLDNLQKQLLVQQECLIRFVDHRWEKEFLPCIHNRLRHLTFGKLF